MKTIFTADKVLDGLEFRERWGLLVEGGEILTIGPIYMLPKKGIERVRYPGCALLPGCVNAHNHSFQSLLRGFGVDMGFFDWRDKALYRFSPLLGPEEVHVGALFAFSEMIRNGITTVADFFYIHDNGNENCEAVIEAAKLLGIRLVLARTMYDWEGAPKKYIEAVDDAAHRCRGLIKKYNASPDRMITVHPAPHSLHAASPEMIRAGFQVAEESNTPCHIHVAEGRYEREQVEARHGAPPIKFLDRLGVLSERMLAVHCVWLDDEELDLMAKRGAKLAYNPSSNMFLGDGITRIPDMLRKGITISLGTDGACSNNMLNIFMEMRQAALLQKVARLDPAVISAPQVFRMGTEGGGIALNLPVGIFRPGYKADFVAIDLNHPSLHPPQNLLNHIVYSLSPQAIHAVVINGREVYKEGRILTIDEKQLLERVRRITQGWI